MRNFIVITFLLFCLAFKPIFSEDKLDKKARPFFVQVEFEVQKNESIFIDKFGFDEFQIYYENKKKFRTYGIPVNENTIIIDHLPLKSERFKSIKVKTFDSKEYVAELDGYGINRDLQTLKIKGSFTSFPKLKPFTPSKNIGPLFSTSLSFREIYPYIQIKEISTALNAVSFFDNQKDIYPMVETESASGPSLLMNKKGEPLALQTRSFYKIKDKLSTFSGAELNTVTVEDLKSKDELIVSMLHKEIYFVHMYFRQKSDNENNGLDTAASFSQNSPEAKIIGILVNEKGDILLPYNIPVEKIKDIEKIEIKTPEKVYPANFKCAFASLGASLINCDQLKGVKPKINWDQPKEEELILAVSLLWNSPEDYQMEVLPNRLLTRDYGVDDRVSYILKHRLNNAQTIFLNFDLNVCGIYSKYKNIENLNEEGEDDYSYGKDNLSFLSLADIKNEIINPEKYLDNRAIQLNRQDALTPTWLGVNVQSPSAALLEHLKILDKTKNGSIGLLVTQIYANSPAFKIGLKPLDVLLSVTYENSDREFEFLKSGEYGYSNYSSFDNSNSGGFAFFPSMKNEVTSVLSKLETGKTVNLKYLRDGKLLTAPFVLEKAPKDFSNADKYVDDDFGIHVKDITYEVKESLRLKENENGVIISEVEQGKAADIAQLQVYFIILKVDNTLVISVANFKELINSKKATGATEFSFTVLFLGKTSLIKVNLKS